MIFRALVVDIWACHIKEWLAAFIATDTLFVEYSHLNSWEAIVLGASVPCLVVSAADANMHHVAPRHVVTANTQAVTAHVISSPDALVNFSLILATR